MSIINKMLQDLDKREQLPGGNAGPGDVVRSVKPVSAWPHARVRLAVMVSLGMVVLALAAWLQFGNKALDKPIAAPAPPPIVDATSPSPAKITLADSSAAPPSQVAAADSEAALKPVAETPVPRLALAGPSGPTGKVVAPATSTRTVRPTSKASRVKTYSPTQLAENLFREAVALDQQGRLEEAKVPLRRALEANPLNVEARQMLTQVQLDTGQTQEARSLLSEGHRLMPEQSGFTMALARLQLENGDSNGALRLLQGGLSTAGDKPQYRAFLAALLLRAQNYDEAVQHYLVALRSDPGNPTWLVGVGVALEAVGKRADAAEAYRRAGGAANLTPEVAKFLVERLEQLRQREPS